jgi:hypothetical protein
VDKKAVDSARIEYDHAAKCVESIRTSRNFGEVTGEHETTTVVTEPNPRLVALMERGLMGRPHGPVLQSREIVSKNLRLLDVFDKRNRKQYGAPKNHLGAPLDPATAAISGLAYLDSMLKEASELAA